MYYLYELCDPITKEVCYIGITNNPNRRKKQHIDGHYFASHIYAVLWSLRISDMDNVIMNVIDEYETAKLAKQAEKKMINHYADNNYPLVNCIHYLARKRISSDDLENRFTATKWYKHQKENTSW